MRGELKIVVRERTGPDAGRVHELRLGRHVIGRDPTGAIQLRSGDVSRQHAILEVSALGVVITDLGSKNGVMMWTAGEMRALAGPASLTDGAVIEVGGIELQIEHPGAQVDEALVRGGEATITRLAGAGRFAPLRPGPLVPLVLTVLFAALVVALLWLE
jgi:pSer/pThr/pTyr-binding forkhead associated (FHA) protein